MSKLQEAYNNLIKHFATLSSLDRLINTKNKFSQEEKMHMFAVMNQHLDYAKEIHADLERRLGLTPTDEEIPFGSEPVTVAEVPAVTPPTPTVSTLIPPLNIVEYGKAFKGDSSKVVSVPVTLEPVLYQSKAGRWSWRTKVATDPDFRHINVSNFFAKAQDANGVWYAMVDATWVTDQPVFVDMCNK